MHNFVYGVHAVTAVLEARPHSVRELWVLAGRDDAQFQHLLALAQSHSIAVHKTERAQLDRIASANHQGVIASVQNAAAWTEQDLPAIVRNAGKHALLLILDGVQDPHNLGACLRTANAAGVHAVIAPKDKSV
ncbi:MAG TPA: RNA methyltransferase substrate-binding domain-containing protein, partial [Gammaproteobacteria bacterium]